MAGTPVDSDLDLMIAEVEEQLGVLFSRVRSTWKESAASIHPELQPVGYKILTTLARLGEANASKLADVLTTDKSVVSRQVRMLEDAGLVVSRADDKDGRARVLSAAPTAIERLKAVRSRHRDRLREILRDQPEHEVRAFTEMLRIISQG